jgi:glucose-1-phosphate adenylyltransferase
MPVPQRVTGARDSVLAMVLAGGEGQRLYPLTRRRAKPAVRFGGSYRMVDFTLSNCLNSGCRRIYLVAQFAASSLQRHVRRGWVPLFTDELGEFIEVVPAQRMAGDRWFAGTADAVFQSLFILQEERPTLVLVLSGDHAYKMDYRPMIEQHRATGASLTIASVPRPRMDCTGLGVLEVDDTLQVVGFEEKPADPRPVPGDPEHALVSMGVYVWNTEDLVRRISHDATRNTTHDFGRDVIPAMVHSGEGVYAYSFQTGPYQTPAYWRDIGTLDAYWQANMELVDVVPVLNLYDADWPIYSYREPAPPAKTVHGELTTVRDSLLSAGCIVSGAHLHRSVLSPNVYIHQGARVHDSVLMDGVEVGRGTVLSRTVVDEGVHIPDGFSAGIDPEADRRRFVVSDEGVTVIPQGIIL